MKIRLLDKYYGLYREKEVHPHAVLDATCIMCDGKVFRYIKTPTLRATPEFVETDSVKWEDI